MSMTNTTLLRNTIYDSGLKLSYIAKQMGLSAYGLQKKIDGESELKASEIAGSCDILKIDDTMQRDAIFLQNKVINNQQTTYCRKENNHEPL